MRFAPPRITNPRLLVALLIGVVALSASGHSSPQIFPQKKKAETPDPLAEFRKLTPAERLRLVEKLDKDSNLFHKVKRGDIRFSIVERGTLKAVDTSDVVCRVRSFRKDAYADTMIKWIVEDGVLVEKGQKILELDSSAFVEEMFERNIRLDEAKAEWIKAKENFESSKEDARIQKRLAEIELSLAKLALKNYDGANQTEVEILKLKVERAKLLGDRSRLSSKAQTAAAEADLKAKQSILQTEKRKLEDVKTTMENCTVYAPQSGLLMYYAPNQSRRRSGAAISIVAQGEPVRVGQKLVEIWNLKKLNVTTNIHEALVTRVRPGQKAVVRVDAFRDKVLSAEVTRISPVASQLDWLSPDVKVYPVELKLIDFPKSLKPGMSAEIRFDGKERKDVLLVPLGATIGATLFDPKRVCFVKNADGIYARNITTEAADGRYAEVKSGLKEGEIVLRNLRDTVYKLGKRRPKQLR